MGAAKIHERARTRIRAQTHSTSHDYERKTLRRTSNISFHFEKRHHDINKLNGWEKETENGSEIRQDRSETLQQLGLDTMHATVEQAHACTPHGGTSHVTQQCADTRGVCVAEGLWDWGGGAVGGREMGWG